jgi:hypothetical protein
MISSVRERMRLPAKRHSSYPSWVRQRFLLARPGRLSRLRYLSLAHKLLDKVSFNALSPEDGTLFQLLQGRLAEAEDRIPEAMDTYGQVIAAEVRPTRAEAVYRTLLLLSRKARSTSTKRPIRFRPRR